MKNTALNPKTEAYALTMMRLRSERVKDVFPTKPNQGGASDQTGNCFVPDEESATARTIRMHEVLHVDFTPKRFKPADLLDQALEDARLHRHCAVTKTLAHTGPRRDELTVALRDLRKVIQQKSAMAPIDSLVTLRAMAICDGEYPEYVHKACNRISPKFEAKAELAIATTKDSKGKHDSEAWTKARKALEPYFRDAAASETPESGDSGKSMPAEKQKDSTPKPSESKPSESKPSEPKADKEADTKEEKSEEKEADKEADKKEEKSDASDSDDSDDSDGDDSEGDEGDAGDEGDEGDEGDGEPGSKMAAPIAPVRKPRKKEEHPDLYTADLTPEFDSEIFQKLNARFPIPIYIRRLDEGTNNVRTIDGERNPRMVVSGASIVARKLAIGMTNPNTRVFRKDNNKGGGGSILIDASGSMCLTDEMLCGFLNTAPMITLGFYNANCDRWYKGNRGNIYIFAANGRRAKTLNLARLRLGIINGNPRDIKAEYGHANLIDYHAIAWLLKQPAPRYLITDVQFTGPWNLAGQRLLRLAKDRNLITLVPTIDAMQKLLDRKNGRSTW